MDNVKTEEIKLFGIVYYTTGGAFYVPMQREQGVYRLENGGFFNTYNDLQIDMHLGFGDIYDDTFVSRFMGDIIMPTVLDSYTIYSDKVVARIVQRCINR